MSYKYHRLSHQVRKLFPGERRGTQQHITNKITNVIRSVKTDVYDTHISLTDKISPFQYSVSREIVVNNTTIHLHFLVD